MYAYTSTRPRWGARIAVRIGGRGSAIATLPNGEMWIWCGHVRQESALRAVLAAQGGRYTITGEPVVTEDGYRWELVAGSTRRARLVARMRSVIPARTVWVSA